MSDFPRQYIPEALKKNRPIDEWESAGYNGLTKLVPDEAFKTAECYSRAPCKKYVCTVCGTDKFEVGYVDYHTALRCPTCQYEICIHEG